MPKLSPRRLHYRLAYNCPKTLDGSQLHDHLSHRSSHLLLSLPHLNESYETEGPFLSPQLRSSTHHHLPKLDGTAHSSPHLLESLKPPTTLLPPTPLPSSPVFENHHSEYHLVMDVCPNRVELLHHSLSTLYSARHQRAVIMKVLVSV
jgi:hypothetical protein